MACAVRVDGPAMMIGSHLYGARTHRAYKELIAFDWSVAFDDDTQTRT